MLVLGFLNVLIRYFMPTCNARQSPCPLNQLLLPVILHFSAKSATVVPGKGQKHGEFGVTPTKDTPEPDSAIQTG